MISEDMAASVFRAGKIVRAVAVSDAADTPVRLARYRPHTDRIRSKYRPAGGGGNIGPREGGTGLNSPLDSPILLRVRQRSLYPAEHAILIMLASLLISRVTARLEVVEHLDAVPKSGQEPHSSSHTAI